MGGKHHSLFFKNLFMCLIIRLPGLCCSTQDLLLLWWHAGYFQLQRVGSSSLTSDQTRGPCTRSTES